MMNGNERPSKSKLTVIQSVSILSDVDGTASVESHNRAGRHIKVILDNTDKSVISLLFHRAYAIILPIHQSLRLLVGDFIGDGRRVMPQNDQLEVACRICREVSLHAIASQDIL